MSQLTIAVHYVSSLTPLLLKRHIGVNDTVGLIHSLVTIAADEHDLTPSDQLLHGDAGIEPAVQCLLYKIGKIL